MGLLGRLLGRPREGAVPSPARLEIVGHGVAVVPRDPSLLWIRPIGEHRMLCLSGVGADRVREAQLIPPGLEVLSAGDGLVELTLGPSSIRAVLHDFERETDLFEWRPAPATDAWTIRSLGFQLPWPERYIIGTTPPGAEWPFELKGPCSDDRGAQEALSSCEDAVLVIVRGPMLPGTMTREQMIPDGQGMVAHGGTDEEPWVELHYHSDSGARFQRHQLVRADGLSWLVTAQGPRALSAEIQRVAKMVTRSNARDHS